MKTDCWVLQARFMFGEGTSSRIFGITGVPTLTSLLGESRLDFKTSIDFDPGSGNTVKRAQGLSPSEGWILTSWGRTSRHPQWMGKATEEEMFPSCRINIELMNADTRNPKATAMVSRALFNSLPQTKTGTQQYEAFWEEWCEEDGGMDCMNHTHCQKPAEPVHKSVNSKEIVHGNWVCSAVCAMCDQEFVTLAR